MLFFMLIERVTQVLFDLLAGAVEYADRISAEEYEPPPAQQVSWTWP